MVASLEKAHPEAYGLAAAVRDLEFEQEHRTVFSQE
jgi:hypothetical protein